MFGIDQNVAFHKIVQMKNILPFNDVISQVDGACFKGAFK